MSTRSCIIEMKFCVSYFLKNDAKINVEDLKLAKFSFEMSKNNFLKSFTVQELDTSAETLSTSQETGVIAGSIIGTLALLTTAIVLGYFARRHYKCTCEKSMYKQT